jgi:hypothetical protein
MRSTGAPVCCAFIQWKNFPVPASVIPFRAFTSRLVIIPWRVEETVTLPGTGCRRQLALSATLVLAAVLTMPRGAAEPLGDVLSDYGLPATDERSMYGHSPDDLITSYAILDRQDLFAIAFYEGDSASILEPPLYLLRFDTESGWLGAMITGFDSGASSEHCVGSVTSVDADSHATYIGTHVTPSASCTFIVSPELEYRDVLYGWILGAFDDGVVIYHDSLVHFAPTHPAMLSLYDPDTGERRAIYPLMPYQRIREEHIARLSITYSDPQWCRQQNHHCDADRFDNSIPGPIALSDAMDALAFVAIYKQPAAAGVPGETTEVLYVYRNVHQPDGIEYRELLLDDFRLQFGDRPIAESLSPAILDQLFMD